MSRPPRTLVLAAILLAPLAVSLAYLGTRPAAHADAPFAASAPCPMDVPAPPREVAMPPHEVPSITEVTPTPRPAVPPVPEVAPTLPPGDDAPGAPVGPSVATGVRDPGDVVLLHERQLVVTTAPDATWSKGPSRPTLLPEGIEVRKTVDLARLPASLQAVLGARFTLYAADGGSCIGEATGLSIYGRETGPNELSAESSREALRAVTDDISADGHVLLARLRAPRGCTGLWARRSDLPAPALFGRVPDDPALRARVRAVIEAQPSILALHTARDAYLKDIGDPESLEPTWSVFVDQSLSVQRWDEVGGPRSFVTAQVGLEEGCGAFNERTAVLFVLADDTLSPHPDPGFLDPLAVMDVDRDGHLEAVVDHGHTLETRGPGDLARGFRFPDYNCPC